MNRSPGRARVARREEAAAIAAMITLAYRVEAFLVDGDRTNEADVLTRMQRGDFLVLEDPPGRMAGCVYVERRGERGYFGMLAVDPAQQRRGHGASLVAAAEDYCRSAGCQAMEIEVINLRTELPPFYRALGYEERSSRPFTAGESTKLPCHFLVMGKSLVAS